MMRRIHLALIIAAILLCLPQASTAAEDCASANCHANKIQGKWVHGPVGAGLCTICHQVVSEQDHKFKFAAEREQLCFGCHDTSRDMMLEDYVHTPVAEGGCTNCHDPHSSAHKYTLKGNASQLCFQCHDQNKFKGDTVHGPVAAGDCNACHNPHGSPFKKQLRNDPVMLCVGCHTDKEGVFTVRHPHAPVTDACTDCHQPHASKEHSLLNMRPPGLCFDCHDDFAEYASVEVPHSPVQAGMCTKCHSVHGSDNPKLFAVPADQLCFTCHTEMKQLVDDSSHHHGPVNDGDCNACHDPHGSSNHRILRKYFPREFYTGYEASKYALCFNCHNQEIAVDEKTKTLTGFRDGERNLHYLHVNKDVKGRSCRACHQVHASNQEKHIRASVPYGSMDWELPVEYTKRDNGGGCVVGCHSPKEYKR